MLMRPLPLPALHINFPTKDTIEEQSELIWMAYSSWSYTTPKGDQHNPTNRRKYISHYISHYIMWQVDLNQRLGRIDKLEHLKLWSVLDFAQKGFNKGCLIESCQSLPFVIYDFRPKVGFNWISKTWMNVSSHKSTYAFLYVHLIQIINIPILLIQPKCNMQ